MKLAIAVPMPEHVSNSFIRNLIEIITYTSKNLEDLEELSYIDRGGVRTDKNRNVIIKEIMEKGMDYVLWLDADMVYPKDIVIRYMEHAPFDIMGCVYFKRKYPFDPVMFVDNDNPEKPFRMVDPLKIPENTIIEVDGIGFGGVMIDCRVYKAMGDDKYMAYGSNFHLPDKAPEQMTHDLAWCRKAKGYGFKVYVHSGVLAGHIDEKLITIEDFKKARQDTLAKVPEISVLIPTIDIEKSKLNAKLMKERAETKCKIIVEEDREKIGWVAMINKMADENPADYYVYAADDAYPSRGWLRIALETLQQTNAGLVGFNEGKYQEMNAGFGLVKHDWIKTVYDKGILFSGYKSHYAEPELTMIAKGQGKFAYNPRASLIEIVYNKDGDNIKRNNEEDRALFRKRKETGFNGLVKDQSILNTID